MRFVLKKYDKVLFVFFGAALIASFLIWAFEERFDEQSWRANPAMRYKMVDDIIDSDLLIGKSKNDVIQLLGPSNDNNNYGKDNLVYKLGKPPSFSEPKVSRLIVIIELGYVNEVIKSSE